MGENNNLEEIQVYEIGYHIVPIVEESRILEQASKIKSLVEDGGGVIVSEEMPKMTAIAYEISKVLDSKKQKFNKAYFGWIKFEADPAQISGIKSKVENIAELLRFIIIKTVKENTMYTPKIPMFRKENTREEKGGEHQEKPKVSEEEIDKSIDELVINQTL